MARHSNEQLTAERKELAALIEPEPGETMAQALARRDAEKDAATNKRFEKLENLLKMQADALLAAEEAATAKAVEGITGTAEPGLKPSAAAPGDYAYYPTPGQPIDPKRAGNLFVTEEGGPPMSPVTGDMTPGYVQWFLTTNGPEATKEKWKGRHHLLPEDVRRAIA
jgi:hypothetical protein